MDDIEKLKTPSPSSSRSSSPNLQHTRSMGHNVDLLSREERTRRALLCLYDSQRLKPPMLHLLSNFQVNCNEIYHNTYYLIFFYLIINLHCFLVIWEPATESHAPGNRWYLYVELFILLLYTFDISLRLIAWYSVWLKKKWNVIHSLIYLLLFIDLIIALASSESTTRWARMLRPILIIIASDYLQRIFEALVLTLPTIYNVFFFVAIIMFIYAILGTYLFKGIYVDAEGQPLKTGNFESFSEALLALFILTSTENYPFITYPAMDVSSWSIIYFISFLAMSYMLLMSSLVAVVFKSYKETVRDQIFASLSKEWYSLCTAFEYLDFDHNGLLSMDECEKLILGVNPNWSPTAVHFCYQLMDTDGNGYIDLVEFLEVGNLLLLKIEELPVEEENVEDWRCFPASFRKKLNRITSSPKFDYLILTCLLLSVVLSILESYEISDQVTLICIVSNWAILLIFCIEISLKLIGRGLKFFRIKWNIFDFVLVLLALIGELLPIIFIGLDGSGNLLALFRLGRISRLYRFPAFARLFRSFRFFQHSTIRHLLKAYLSVMPFFLLLLIIIYILCYVFVVLGMALFHGIYDVSGPNFDNFGNAFLCIAQLAFANNWPDLMVIAIEGGGYAASIYFCLFYFLMIPVCLNLVIAVIIELYFNAQGKHNDMTVRWHHDEADADDLSGDKILKVSKKTRWLFEVVSENLKDIRSQLLDQMLESGEEFKQTISRHQSHKGGRNDAPDSLLESFGASKDIELHTYTDRKLKTPSIPVSFDRTDSESLDSDTKKLKDALKTLEERHVLSIAPDYDRTTSTTPSLSSSSKKIIDPTTAPLEKIEGDTPHGTKDPVFSFTKSLKYQIAKNIERSNKTREEEKLDVRSGRRTMSTAARGRVDHSSGRPAHHSVDLTDRAFIASPRFQKSYTASSLNIVYEEPKIEMGVISSSPIGQSTDFSEEKKEKRELSPIRIRKVLKEHDPSKDKFTEKNE